MPTTSEGMAFKRTGKNIRSILNYDVDPKKGGIEQIILGPPEVAEAPRTEEPVDAKPITPERSILDDIDNAVSQFGAGFTDIITSVPMLFGLAGAGVGAGFSEIFDKGPQDFTENFKRELGQGLNNALLNASLDAQTGYNELIGIDHPKTTVDRIARSLGSAVPIPGFSAAAALGPAASTARAATNLLTPAIMTGRGGKDFAGRAAAQAGAVVSIDEGIRDAIGEETIISPLSRAISTFPSVDEADALTYEDFIAGGGQFNRGEMAFTATGRNRNDEESLPAASMEFTRTSTVPLPIPKPTKKLGTLERLQVLEQEVRAKEEEDDNRAFWWSIAGAALVPPLVKGASIAIHRQNIKAAPEVGPPKGGTLPKVGQLAIDIDPFQYGSLKFKPGATYLRSLPGTFGGALTDASDYVRAGFISRHHALSAAMRDMGYGERAVQSVVQNSHADSAGMARTLRSTGVWGQGYIPIHKIRPLDDMARDYQNLSRADRKLIEAALAAGTEKARVVQEAGQTLFTNTVRTPALDATIDRARNVTHLRELMDEYTKFLDNHLGYLVHRDRLTGDLAKQFKGRFTNPDGSSAYVPVYSLDHIDMITKIAKSFGIHSQRGKELLAAAEMAKLRFRGTDKKVDKPVNIINALQTYSASVFEHANTNSYQLHVLEALTGIEINGATVTRVSSPFRKRARVRASTDDPSGLGIEYIGKGEVDAKGDVVNIQGDSQARKNIGGSYADVEKQLGDEAFLVYHKGIPHVFKVGDLGVRRGLEVNPRFGGPLMFFDHYKRLFSSFTTGNRSVFAPFSAAYAMQQGAVNSFAREGWVAGLGVPIRAVQGTTHLAWEGFSREFSGYLAQRLATNFGVLTHAPGVVKAPVKALQQALENSFRGAMVNKVRAETGLLHSGYDVHAAPQTLLEIKQAVGAEYANHFPGVNELSLIWRMWKQTVSAVHEGTAYGLQLKRIGQARRAGIDITPEMHRRFATESKELVGDMRNVGASPVARFAHAAVPFSAPMIQSWATLGAAFKTNPGRFTAGVAALIGAPTITELSFNTMMSLEGNPDREDGLWPDAGGAIDPTTGEIKLWGGMEYIFNGYTPAQLTSNAIFLRPGKPPWEALLVPISPEWGLARGYIIDVMKNTFDLAKVGSVSQLAERGEIDWLYGQAALAKVGDIAMPPKVAAALSAFGIDVSIGPQYEEATDIDNPPGLALLDVHGLPRAQHITARNPEALSTGSNVERRVAAVVQDILGSFGTFAIGVYEAVDSGATFSAETMGLGGDTDTAVSRGLEAAGDGLTRVSRYGQGIFDNRTLQPNNNQDAVSRKVRSRIAGLQELQKSFKVYERGGLFTPSGYTFSGNTVVPPDDPIWFDVAASAAPVLKQVNLWSTQISDRRSDMATVHNATNMSRVERNDKLAALNLEITMYKDLQLQAMLTMEDDVNAFLNERYRTNPGDEPIRITFDTVSPGPDLSKKSILQELR